MRPETREKIAWEHRGTNLPADEYLPNKVETETLTEIQITAMKEEVRNETAKACARSLPNQEIADGIKNGFSLTCQVYQDGNITHQDLLKFYHQALMQLNEIQF